MRALPIYVLCLIYCFALSACVTSPAIRISVVDRYGAPQPNTRLTVSWLHRTGSPGDRTILLVDHTDDHGRFTIRDTELPDLVDASSIETRRSGAIHHLKWGDNVIVIR
jgi:hypothetical protein